MSLILSMETSTNVCSVALYKEAELLAVSEITIQKSHSSLLTVMIQDIVQHSGYALNELKAVAVSAGPGSYTGLRIGSSVAKGLCYSLDIPLIAIDTLYAMAVSVNRYNTEEHLVCPMIDARRMEVYHSLLDNVGNVIEPSAPKILDENSFSEILDNNSVLFFGNGAFKFYELVRENDNVKYIAGVYPSAKDIGVLAWRAFQKKDFADIVYFEPNYLKEFMSGVRQN